MNRTRPSSYIPIDRQTLITEYVDKRKSAFAIARMYNCGNRTIYSKMEKFNIPRRSCSEAMLNYCNINIPGDILRHKYCVLKMSASEIGREMNCSKEPILSRLRLLGIPIHLSAAPGRFRGIPCPQRAREQATIPKDQLVYEYVILKMPCTQLANKYNCSHFAICDRLRKYGVELRRRATRVNKQVIYDLYITKQMSCGEIATKYKCDPERIRHLLIKYSIPRRTKAQANQLKWQNYDYRISTSRRLHRALNIAPNKMEIKVLNKLDKLAPNEWAFVGNGKFFIESLNPDFVNVDGKKQIIEVFGDFWHRGQDPVNRIKLFKEYGYDTLVLWEREIRRSKIFEQKMIDFIGK